MTAKPNINQPQLDCLICGGREIDEAMKQPEFTQIFRCFLQLLSLATEDFEEMRLFEVVVCLNCGVKFRQIYLLHNQLLDIQNQLKDYCVQMENDVVGTFMRSTLSTNSEDINSIVRKKIIDGLQLQITSSSAPIQTCIEEQVVQDAKNNISTEDLHSQPSNSPALDFENNIIFCDAVDDQRFEIKIEFETNTGTEAEDSLNNVDYSPLPAIFSVEATEVSREPEPEPGITKRTSVDIEHKSESDINEEIEDQLIIAALQSSRKRRKLSPINQNNEKESEENIPHSEKKSVENRTFKIGTTVFRNPFVLLEVLPSSVLPLSTDISPTPTTKDLQAGSTSNQVLDEDVDIPSSTTSDTIDFEASDKFTNNNGPRPRPSSQKSQTGALVCSIAECKKTFSTRRQQRRHVKRHSSMASENKNKKPVRKPLVRIPPATPTSYMCEHCGQTLKTRKSFDIHLRRHGPIQYKCQFCTRGYRDKVHLKAHEAMHTGNFSYDCNHCDMKFASQKQLRNHKLRKHEEYFVDGKSPFECVICHIVLANFSCHRLHMYQHSGAHPFRCPVCGTGQPTKTAHNIHMKSHAEEREFSCSVCEKTFKFKDALVVHMRSHTGERPYQCKSCPKNYIDRAALRKHTRAVHNDGGTSFICHICGKINPSSHYLNIHLTSHRRKEARVARPKSKSRKTKAKDESVIVPFSSD